MLSLRWAVSIDVTPEVSIMSKTETWPIKQLVEGVHYYMEDGLMVLTEHYHRIRGTCCGNACRHCPYDHRNVN
jgi:hypothetical protein